MEACYKAANELYDEIARKNPKFKKIYEPWKKFRDDEFQWFRVAEQHFDNFMLLADRPTEEPEPSTCGEAQSPAGDGGAFLLPARPI